MIFRSTPTFTHPTYTTDGCHVGFGPFTIETCAINQSLLLLASIEFDIGETIHMATFLMMHLSSDARPMSKEIEKVWKVTRSSAYASQTIELNYTLKPVTLAICAAVSTTLFSREISSNPNKALLLELSCLLHSFAIISGPVPG